MIGIGKVSRELLKVIIVDDELLIRVGIKSCLEWEKHGFEVVGHAEDGLKALELIRSRSPDIVLADIKMPNMDGLELISAVKKQYPHIKIIVLSCYNDMDLVKKAMKLGAEDYILKLSVQPETLLEVLQKSKEAIEEQRKNEQASRNLENELRVNKYIIKSNLYKKMIDSSIEPDEFRRELNNLGVCLDFDSYFVMCCGIDDYLNAPMRSSLEDRHLLRFSFVNILEELLSEYCEYDIAETEDGIYALLIVCNDQLTASDAEKVCRKIMSTIKKYLNISASFGVSKNQNDIRSIRNAYEQAYHALGHKFFAGRESIIFLEEERCFANDYVSIDIDQENLLQKRFEELDTNGSKEVINTFIDNLNESRMYSPDAIKLSAIEIVHSLMKIAKKCGLSGKMTDSSFRCYAADIFNTETLSDLKAWLENFVDRLAFHLSDFKLERNRPEIARIKTYIKEHVNENISLEKASEISNMSKSYFSTVFKKESGESFTDYVNRIKIEKARELILEYGLRSYEAAERVGIYDESYFSKLFKKYIGQNPSKIKKN